MLLPLGCNDDSSTESTDGLTFQGQDLATWAGRLAAADRSTRREAMQTLRDAESESLPLLSALLSHAMPQVRKRADEVLGQIGPAAVPYLARVARTGPPSARYHAISVLGDLGRDSAPAVKEMAAGLADEDLDVAREAGWALAALREMAAPAVPALSAALSHHDVVVRINAAGALAAVGRRAAGAVVTLTQALDDPDSAVRRSAAVALRSIGPQAAPATASLTRALQKDENLYVRIAAAGALGGIGELAASAAPDLRQATSDPSLRSEAEWALARILGEAPVDLQPASVQSVNAVSRPTTVRSGEWPMFGRTPSRNAVADSDPVPTSWDVATGRNVRWGTQTGHITYGSPVVAGDMVLIGGDNGVPRELDVTQQMGTLLAFRAEDGVFVWHDLAPPLGRGIDEFLLPSTTSTPLVEGDRVYYVTAQAQLRCLDLAGFTDGENDGPIISESRTSAESADLIWELDMGGTLGVFPHEAANGSVVSVGDLLMVCTSNGVDEAHTNVPAPNAPSFIGVDKWTGRVVWQALGPGANVLHGQWSSPSIGRAGDRWLAFFGGGDGWLYALDPATGAEAWRFDGNPKEAVWRPSPDIPGMVFRNSIVACPVYHDGVVYVAMGQDPEHGSGKGLLHAIDVGGRGDVTESAARWQYTDIRRCIGNPIVDGDLLFIADFDGYLHCVDRQTGGRQWVHDLLAPVWGAAVVVDGKVYVGDEDGRVTIARAAREKEIIGEVSMNAPIFSAPAVADGVLYIATARQLFAIAETP